MRSIRMALLLLPAATLVLHSTSALAAVSSRPTATASFASATLQPPTNLTVTKNCTNLTVTLNWVATTSTYATGYQLMYTMNNVSQPSQAVAGRTTVTMTYPITRGATYNLSLASVYRSWTSLTTPMNGPILC